MVNKKGWEEFRETGMLLIINQILHIFGWAIVMEVNNENGDVVNCYPARVKYRGFDKKSMDESYINITKYMKENAKQLYNEVKE